MSWNYFAVCNAYQNYFCRTDVEQFLYKSYTTRTGIDWDFYKLREGKYRMPNFCVLSIKTYYFSRPSRQFPLPQPRQQPFHRRCWWWCRFHRDMQSTVTLRDKWSYTRPDVQNSCWYFTSWKYHHSRQRRRCLNNWCELITCCDIIG